MDIYKDLLEIRELISKTSDHDDLEVLIKMEQLLLYSVAFRQLDEIVGLYKKVNIHH